MLLILRGPPVAGAWGWGRFPHGPMSDAWDCNLRPPPHAEVRAKRASKQRRRSCSGWWRASKVQARGNGAH